MAEEGNSLRDVMKDALAEFLTSSQNEAGLVVMDGQDIMEKVPDMVDVVFRVLMVPEPLQDMPYPFCQDCAKEYEKCGQPA